ncbi:hypothetical protein ElyMa_005946400 [Elysia marginata]|uniref:MATH domain-containing protein n=1 Tax=Elysia marginata TaxID=1093978 RepID=A0AAV4G9N6_9GAST|nr:hypothetical protein ElyMa_005946400 [Elysia marginata]
MLWEVSTSSTENNQHHAIQALIQFHSDVTPTRITRPGWVISVTLHCPGSSMETMRQATDRYDVMPAAGCNWGRIIYLEINTGVDAVGGLLMRLDQVALDCSVICDEKWPIDAGQLIWGSYFCLDPMKSSSLTHGPHFSACYTGNIRKCKVTFGFFSSIVSSYP